MSYGEFQVFPLLAQLSRLSQERLEQACAESSATPDLIAVYRDQQHHLRLTETALSIRILEQKALSDEDNKDAAECIQSLLNTIIGILDDYKKYVPVWVEAAVVLELCELHQDYDSGVMVVPTCPNTWIEPAQNVDVTTVVPRRDRLVHWRNLGGMFNMFLDLRRYFSKYGDCDFESLLSLGEVHVYPLLLNLVRKTRERLVQACIGATEDLQAIYVDQLEELQELEASILAKASTEPQPDSKDMHVANQLIEQFSIRFVNQLDGYVGRVPTWVQVAVVLVLGELRLDAPCGWEICPTLPEEGIEGRQKSEQMRNRSLTK